MPGESTGRTARRAQLDEAILELEEAMAEHEDLIEAEDWSPSSVRFDVREVSDGLLRWANLLNRAAYRVIDDDRDLFHELRAARQNVRDVVNQLLDYERMSVPEDIKAPHERFMKASRRLDEVTASMAQDVGRMRTVARYLNFAAQVGSGIYAIVSAAG